MALRAFVVLLCLLPWPDVAAAADVEPGEILRQMLVRYRAHGSRIVSLVEPELRI